MSRPGSVRVARAEPGYNHPDAIANPWTWALIHPGFVLAACVAMTVDWRAHETSRAYPELILDSAPYGICGVDRRGVITFMSPSGARTLGWPGRELVGRAVEDVLLPPGPDDAPPSLGRSPIHGACADGQARDLKAQMFLHKDGSSVPVDYVATPFRQSGRITGAVITFRDISEHVKAAEARAQLEAQLESQKMEAVGRLAGGIAHDFNNRLGLTQKVRDVLDAAGPLAGARSA